MIAKSQPVRVTSQRPAPSSKPQPPLDHNEHLRKLVQSLRRQINGAAKTIEQIEAIVSRDAA